MHILVLRAWSRENAASIGNVTWLKVLRAHRCYRLFGRRDTSFDACRAHYHVCKNRRTESDAVKCFDDIDLSKRVATCFSCEAHPSFLRNIRSVCLGLELGGF